MHPRQAIHGPFRVGVTTQLLVHGPPIGQSVEWMGGTLLNRLKLGLGLGH